jgi:hypothetical protein
MAGLTEAGKIALRVLHAGDRPMMAWEIGQKGFRHISDCEYRDERRNPRTLAAASAARKLAADGWIIAGSRLKKGWRTLDKAAYIDVSPMQKAVLCGHRQAKRRGLLCRSKGWSGTPTGSTRWSASNAPRRR